MLKRLIRCDNAPSLLIESKMIVLFQGFPTKSGDGSNKDNNPMLDVVRFLWQQKQLCFWVPIVLVPLVIFNSCFLYSSFVREESPYSSIFHQEKLNSSSIQTSPGKCDLLRGIWVPDRSPPIYTNETCKYIQPFQNCMKNGKPDAGYLNWRWKPHGCKLPRFDPVLFLQLMTGKKLVFFGDSLARNHMQSLLCSLSQVEEPEKLYTRVDRDVKWGFPSHNFTLTIFWSPFLVKHVQVEDAPTLLFNVHLDVPHQAWRSSLPEYDIAVVSASQWFFRPSIYYMNNTIIGCNEYSGQNYTQMGFISAFQIALETTLRSVASTVGYKGTTIVRTVTVEHFEHGTWSTGGTCNRTGPYVNQSIELSWLPRTFNKIQVDEFEKVVARGSSNGSKFKLLNVTQSMFLRPDGHPGPYRLFEPFANGNNGKHVQNDCLHWCLPGPIDMWNQLLLETIKQEHGQYAEL